MSKGSNQRPCKVPKKKYDENWDKIFGKSKKVTLSIIRKDDGSLEKRYEDGWKSENEKTKSK